MNRARFLLRAYLRARLLKIQAHARHILSTEAAGRLSEREVVFAEAYVRAVAQVMNDPQISFFTS